MFFCVQEKKEILGASPAGRVPDPRKSNLHEIIYIKLGMALNAVDGKALKDYLIKSKCKMFDPGLKVNKSHNVLQFMMCNT